MTDWGSGEWDAHFNEANARAVAEAEADRHGDAFRGIFYALLFSAPIWGFIIIVVVLR